MRYSCESTARLTTSGEPLTTKEKSLKHLSQRGGTARAALRFLKKAMKRYGNPLEIVTDGLRSYRAAMKEIGNEARQTTGRWLNNRAENSHQPFRRRERAMAKFRNAKSLQKFTSIHSSLHNHFNQERHLYSRQTFKLNRAAALAQWRQLAA